MWQCQSGGGGSHLGRAPKLEAFLQVLETVRGGCGSKLNRRGYADSGPCFPLTRVPFWVPVFRATARYGEGQRTFARRTVPGIYLRWHGSWRWVQWTIFLQRGFHVNVDPGLINPSHY